MSVRRDMGNGTTHRIRKQLNFVDDNKWKKFSNRRLELIDKFGLSHKKASEQDDNIKQIANILRLEFNYSINFANEFEKLVTAAVQSVRRNRKRSKKRILPAAQATSTTATATATETVIVPPPTPIRTPTPSSLPVIKPKSIEETTTTTTTTTTAFENDVPRAKAMVIRTNVQNYNDIIRSILSDLTDTERISASNASQTLPSFLRDKILLQISCSRTCSEFIKSSTTVDLHSNVIKLGELSIKSAITFVVERFFNTGNTNNNASLEYLNNKLASMEVLANLAVQLFNPITSHNLANLPTISVQLKILYFTFGAIIKDFGFDSCIYPMSEIIHQLVMNNYSFLIPPSNAITRSTILSALPMKPQLANKDISKKIYIKFNDKQQLFNFPLLSNGPPTIQEIITNCTKLFNIVQPAANLGLYHNNKLILHDTELTSLFNSIATPNEIFLEIKDRKIDALSMLSAVSVQIKSEEPRPQPISPPCSIARPITPSSISTLDNIISRISKTSPQTASSTDNKTKNSFQNGNLPQPVYQPLL